MKQLNSSESKEFIRTASDKDFLSYIEVRPFKNTVEPDIYLYRSTEISLIYLKKYGFDEATRTLIFKENNRPLVMELLDVAENTKQKAIIKDFLAYGAYSAVKSYTENHEYEYYPEQRLFAENKEDALLNLIKTTKLSPFAKLRIIMEGNRTLLRTLIDSPLQNLDKREEDAFFAYANEVDILYWMSQRKQNRRAKTWHQKYVIRFGNEKQLEDIIYERKLNKDSEEFFFRCAPFYLVARYIKIYKPQKAEEYLFNYCKHAEVMSYLLRNNVSETGERFLLKRANHDEIMCFIDKQNFNDENEVAFINRGMETEIKTYLRYHSLCDMAQVALIKSNDMINIIYFVQNYPLADAAYEEIMKNQRIKHWLFPHLAEIED